jgi:hypothetical protein
MCPPPDPSITSKTCSRCKEEKPLEAFSVDRYVKGWRARWCEACWHVQNQRYYIEPKRRQAKERHIRMRIEALNRYGGACQCCGERRYEFLAFDHINGGGRAHRASVPAARMPVWLEKNGWPPGFRVLCHNCNMAVGIYGICPHEVAAPAVDGGGPIVSVAAGDGIPEKSAHRRYFARRTKWATRSRSPG